MTEAPQNRGTNKPMQRQRQRTTVTRRTIQRIRQHNDQHRRDQDPKPPRQTQQRTQRHRDRHKEQRSHQRGQRHKGGVTGTTPRRQTHNDTQEPQRLSVCWGVGNCVCVCAGSTQGCGTQQFTPFVAGWAPPDEGGGLGAGAKLFVRRRLRGDVPRHPPLYR